MYLAAGQSERAGADLDDTGCVGGAGAATLSSLLDGHVHVPVRRKTPDCDRDIGSGTANVPRPLWVRVPARHGVPISYNIRSHGRGVFLVIVRRTEVVQGAGKLIVVYCVSWRFKTHSSVKY